MNIEEDLSVIIIGTDIEPDTPFGLVMTHLIHKLKEDGVLVRVIRNMGGLEDGRFSFGASADCLLIDWSLPEAADTIALIRSRISEIPIFLMTEPGALPHIPLDVIREVNEYVWVLGDTPEFIAGRIHAAARRYRDQLLPPMFRELVTFSDDFEYSWHTPGHAGGTAFLKSPVGRIFYQFFGEQMLRSDLSISVGELGSLLDHSGPIGEAEVYAARVFGADRTYFVTNGTSTSNRVIYCAMVTPGDVVLVDRNCHKSLEHAVTMTHATPVYLIPSRNRYGIIGPIHPQELYPETIQKKIQNHPLAPKGNPVIGTVTNSTYDGLCYHADKVEDLLGKTLSCIHFDEAWYGYARFNPIYSCRFGMREESKGRDDGPTVFTTQSTHKLLAALSQASMIHMREGKHFVDPNLFNEAFMMHASTSPFYPIIASLDVSSKMMDGTGGRSLTQESIDEAVRFRQSMGRIKTALCEEKPDDWWFEVWQPDIVTIPEKPGEKVRRIPFEDAPPALLGTEPSCWVLHPGDDWHGFEDLEDEWCMLDPIKVTILTPGMNRDGTLQSSGIPAALVVKFLDKRGIINEKSGDYNILFLFSMGITKGKWGTLVSEFFEFKRLFDENTPLERVFPDLTTTWPERYGSMTIQDLAGEMHTYIKDNNQTGLGNEACATLPEPVMTPAEAYRHLVRGEVEQVLVSEMENRIVATGVVPYPPGIPVLMPGERAGSSKGPVLSYLCCLEQFDREFPGFGHDIHGVEVNSDSYYVFCIKE